MSAYKSDFLQVLADRGFIHQVSEPEALDARAAAGPITAYIGFDCTAPSLHVGSLLPIMMLYWMQQTGHRPIALMGGGTTRVGDPSGKDESRRILTDEDIGRNLVGIRAVFDKFLKFEGAGGNAIMANNADWLNGLNYIDFLRDVGRHFSVNRMLSFDSVKLRLDRQHELSFLEFNYMILQAYDFVELHKRTGCILQMGGSDQWGNIVNGIDLGRRMLNAQLFALTTPLLTTSSGAKMGKTAAGAVWLDASLVSPYDYWQYWRNTEDGDVTRFLKLFTVLPLDDIARLAALKGQDINEAKKVLATEATALVHGREAAEKAAGIAQQTFEHGEISPNLPTINISEPKLGVLTAFQRAGLVNSTGEARRQIKGGGIRINDVPISDEKMILTSNELTPERVIKLSLGRKRHVLLKMDELAIASKWLDDSMARWEALTSNLPPKSSARFPHGHFAISYWLQGKLKHQSLTDTLEAVRASTVEHTGWPEFWVPTKNEIKPYSYEGTVECWMARDGEDHGPAHSDFWRASPDGRLFLVRGHKEDQAQDRRITPGTVFDITIPTWRVGEALLHAANMAKALGDELAEVTLVAEWSGLSGRALTHLEGRRLMFDTKRTLEDKLRNNVTVSAAAIATSLPELVGKFVAPLYESFDFFRLPASLPSEELAVMRRNRF